MTIRKKAIAIAASAGFLALMTGAGMSAATGSGFSEAHHPQAAEGNAPEVSRCLAPGPGTGGGMTGTGMMGRGMMPGTASGCGPAASAAIPAPDHARCGHAAAHGCANAPPAS